MEEEGRNPPQCPVWPKRMGALSTTFLASALALTALVDVGAQADTRQAATYLQSAVDSYRRGHFQQSFFFLRAARKHDPPALARSASAHRLEAFLLLADGHRAQAAAAMVRSVALKPDPVLFYLLGEHNLSLRSLRQARNAYRDAVTQHDRLYERGSGAPEGTPLFAALPFACPREGGASAFLEGRRSNEFAFGHKAAHLWDRTLHPAELALAAYQWLTLERHLNSTDGAAVEKARQALLRHQSGLDTFEAKQGHAELVSVVRAPDDPEALRACLKNLVQTEQRLERSVALGSTSPAREHLLTVREMQRRVYRNAIGNFGQLRDYYMYGTNALRQGNHVEALHALRRALSRSGLKPTGAGMEGDARQAALVYRALELVYRKLDRPDDARTVADLARHIETYLNESGAVATEARTENLRISLLRTSRLFLYNREGLLLLLEYARATRDGKQARHWSDRLEQRDRRFEYTEMLSAFPEF